MNIASLTTYFQMPMIKPISPKMTMSCVALMRVKPIGRASKRSLMKAVLAENPIAAIKPTIKPPYYVSMPIQPMKIARINAVMSAPMIAETIETGEASSATCSAVLPMPASHCLLKAKGALNQIAPKTTSTNPATTIAKKFSVGNSISIFPYVLMR